MNFQDFKFPGLTALESRVYFSLISVGEASAKNLVLSSNTDRADVYRTLNALQQQGLVTVHLNKPKTYKAAPLHDALQILLERSRVETLQLQGQLVKLRKIAHASHETPDDKQPLLLMWNNQNLPQSVLRAWTEAQESIDTFSDDQPECVKSSSQWLIWNNCIIEQTLKRKVRFRLIIAPTKKSKAVEKNLRRLINYPNFELKVGVFPFLRMFTIFDQKEVWINTGKYNQDKQETISMNFETTTRAFHFIFEEIWRKAKHAAKT
jgi:sugar-specific transcriptional regulator TrmB